MNRHTSKMNSKYKESLYNFLCHLFPIKIYNKLNKWKSDKKDLNIQKNESQDEINFLFASLFQHWLDAYQMQNNITTASNDKLEKLSEVMDHKTHHLTQKFQQLYKNSQDQSNHVHELIQLSSGILIEEQLIPIEEIATHVLNTLSVSTKSLHQLAERALLMSNRVLEATTTLKDIETSVKAIGLINKKTKYLSLNAMIEALKEQQGKEGRMAVANEVRELSNDTQAITTIIVEQSEKMRTILEDAQKTLEDVASFDFSQNMDAEEFINKMIEGLVGNNKKMNSIMDVTTDSTKEFAEIASNLIKSMQYEDRAQQDIQNLIKELSRIKEIFNSLPVETKQVMEKYLNSFENKTLNSDLYKNTNEEPQELLANKEKEGDIILF
jgi:methyl-accepting chemotaxis protein